MATKPSKHFWLKSQTRSKTFIWSHCIGDYTHTHRRTRMHAYICITYTKYDPYRLKCIGISYREIIRNATSNPFKLSNQLTCVTVSFSTLWKSFELEIRRERLKNHRHHHNWHLLIVLHKLGAILSTLLTPSSLFSSRVIIIIA